MSKKVLRSVLISFTDSDSNSDSNQKSIPLSVLYFDENNEIKVSEPEGGKYALPEPGTFRPSGGAAPHSALPASAMVMAKT